MLMALGAPRQHQSIVCIAITSLSFVMVVHCWTSTMVSCLAHHTTSLRRWLLERAADDHGPHSGTMVHMKERAETIEMAALSRGRANVGQPAALFPPQPAYRPHARAPKVLEIPVVEF